MTAPDRAALGERAARALSAWAIGKGIDHMIERITTLLVEVHGEASRSATARCIDVIGGDTTGCAVLTLEELERLFFDTHRSLEQREIECEREACAKKADG